MIFGMGMVLSNVQGLVVILLMDIYRMLQQPIEIILTS